MPYIHPRCRRLFWSLWRAVATGSATPTCGWLASLCEGKTPYSDGTTQVAFDPVDFIAQLAALVPKPRVNLTRDHGVLAPSHPCSTATDTTIPGAARDISSFRWEAIPVQQHSISKEASAW